MATIIQPEVSKVTEVSVLEKGDNGSSSSLPLVSGAHHTSPNDRDNWITGVKKRMPWVSLGALVFVLLTSVGQMLVLHFADGAPKATWKLAPASPNVCLSILNGGASLAIAFAVMNGIAISWWRRALQGASIKELHYTWNFTASITSVFRRYRYFNFIALAALATKIAIVDGVFFQRALGSYSDTDYNRPNNRPLVIPVSDTFPFTGNMGYKHDGTGQMTTLFSTILINWIGTGSGINAADNVYGCLGASCVFGMHGIGFTLSCQSVNNTDNFVNTAPNVAGPSNRTIFQTSFSLQYPDSNKPYSWIQFNSTIPVDNTTTDASNNTISLCPTTFTTSVCELRPAKLNYTMIYINPGASDEKEKYTSKNMYGVSGTAVGFSCQNATDNAQSPGNIGHLNDGSTCGTYNETSTHNQLFGVEVLGPVDIKEPWGPGANSSLQGLYNAFVDAFTSEAQLIHENQTWSVQQTGQVAPIVMYGDTTNRSSCAYSYSDPRSNILQRINALTAQTSTSTYLPSSSGKDSVWSNNATEPYQVVWFATSQNQTQVANALLNLGYGGSSIQFDMDVWYQTDYRFAGAAVGLTVVVILCILPVFWGFWQLGRDVTLGPLEIAFAFQGPTFSSVHGVNGHADAVVKTVGKIHVKYAEVEDETGKRLAFKTA